MEFDKYQREAIECDGSAIVIATAGSGKTTTLVEKVRCVAKTIPPKNITCLSFMRKAANQLSDKLVKADKTLKDVNVRTIHSLASKVLYDKGYTFMNKGYGNKNEWGEARFIKEAILPNYNRFVIEDCDDVIETLIEYARLRTCRMEEHTDYFEDFEKLMSKSNLERFYDDFVFALRERKLFVFDTACSEALRIVGK
jgi:superfamily I DNA/RNA helicase